MNRPSRRWPRRLLVLLIAALVQVPLWWSMDGLTHGRTATRLCAESVGRYVRLHPASLTSALMGPYQDERCPTRARPIRGMAVRIPKKKPKEIEPPLPDDAKIVETPEQPEPIKPKPVQTKLVSNKTTRTKKQTKRRKDRNAKSKTQGSVATKQTSKVQSKQSQSEKPTVTTEKRENIKAAEAAEKLREADKGRQKPKTIMRQGRDTQLLLPPTSDRAALANYQALSGTFGTRDHLPEIDDGKKTVLNANRYKYADFFLSVKSAVEKQWRPAELYRRRDPTGRAYGVKDRYTVLRVTLDENGRLLRTTTTRASDLDFMDEEARHAFKRAQPFKNPPKGLLNASNNVVFEFGFYFEITAGKSRFDWRRL